MRALVEIRGNKRTGQKARTGNAELCPKMRQANLDLKTETRAIALLEEVGFDEDPSERRIT